MGRALRLEQARGPRTGNRAGRCGHKSIAAIKPRASRSDVKQSGFGVGQKCSIAD